MNILASFIFSLLNFAFWASGSNEYIQKEAYWLDYDGSVPYNAIEGGTFNDTVIYVGQVLVPGISGIIPVSIYPGNTTVTGTYFYVGSFTTDNYIKILCTNNKEKIFYKWLPATASNFPDVTNLVVGGYDFDAKVYIGRTNINGNTFIGKVFGNSSLHIITNSNTEDHVQSFEILTFLPEEESISVPRISSKSGYYWRPYDGAIPEDAIEGGRMDSKTTYIGLVPTGGGIAPANIFPGVPEALGEYFGPYRQSKHVQILCSNDKNYFKWLNATTTTVLAEDELVLAGIENTDLLTYIARAEDRNDIVIGKMFLMFNPYEINVMHVVANMNSEKRNEFQVLTYKPKEA